MLNDVHKYDAYIFLFPSYDTYIFLFALNYNRLYVSSSGSCKLCLMSFIDLRFDPILKNISTL